MHCGVLQQLSWQVRSEATRGALPIDEPTRSLLGKERNTLTLQNGDTEADAVTEGVAPALWLEDGVCVAETLADTVGEYVAAAERLVEGLGPSHASTMSPGSFGPPLPET